MEIKKPSSKNFQAVKREFLKETSLRPCQIFWVCNKLPKKEKRFLVHLFDDSCGESAFIHAELFPGMAIPAGSKLEEKVNEARLFILQLCIEMTKKSKRK